MNMSLLNTLKKYSAKIEIHESLEGGLEKLCEIEPDTEFLLLKLGGEDDEGLKLSIWLFDGERGHWAYRDAGFYLTSHVFDKDWFVKMFDDEYYDYKKDRFKNELAREVSALLAEVGINDSGCNLQSGAYTSSSLETSEIAAEARTAILVGACTYDCYNEFVLNKKTDLKSTIRMFFDKGPYSLRPRTEFLHPELEELNY